VRWPESRLELDGAEHPGAGMPSFGFFQHSVHSKMALASSFLLSMSCGREAPAASLPRTIPSWNCRSIIRRRSPLPGARYHPWRRTALASVSSVTEAQHERHRDQRGSYDNRRGYGRPRHRDCLVPVAALPGAAAASARATKLSPDPVGMLTRGHLLTPRQPIECRKSRREIKVRYGQFAGYVTQGSLLP
jgi:hypothetical protein